MRLEQLHALADEHRRQRARVIARDRTAKDRPRRLHQHQRDQAAVDDERGIALDLPGVRQVVVDAVGIVGQRRIAEELHRVGLPFHRMIGLLGRGLSLGLHRGLARAVRRRGKRLAIDQVLLLGDRHPRARAHLVDHGHQHERSGAPGFRFDLLHGRDALDHVADAQRLGNFTRRPANMRRVLGNGGSRSSPVSGWPSRPILLCTAVGPNRTRVPAFRQFARRDYRAWDPGRAWRPAAAPSRPKARRPRCAFARANPSATQSDPSILASLPVSLLSGLSRRSNSGHSWQSDAETQGIIRHRGLRPACAKTRECPS